MAIALASKPGLTGATVLSIPKNWDSAWFRGLINNVLKGADVRNAIGVNGIKVTGNIASPYATIGFGAPVTLPGPVTITGGGLVVGTPTGGNEGAGTVNALNYYLNGALVFQSGTFTATLTGCTTSPTQQATYSIANNICTVSIAGASNLTGTSNSTSMTVTGLPAVCQPATQEPFVPCSVEDNTALGMAMALIAPGSGTITFFRGSGSPITFSATGFTAAGTKGCDGTVLTYSLQ